YHFFSERIDLHLCDDVGVGRSSHPNLTDGGALQISVQRFQIDYYPYHLAKADRSHWAKYREASIPPALWLEQSLNSFREAILNLSQPNRPPQHASLERTTNFGQQQTATPSSPAAMGHQRGASTASQTANGSQQPTAQSVPGTPNSGSSHSTVSPMKKHVLDNLAKLMCACVVMKIEEFTLYRVTTSGNKQMPKEFVAGKSDLDKKAQKWAEL
uniref:Uncharacterized protein n=1 Tax=Anopheles maculatus TaxID=74869 RepID=A0A182T5U9_9DIPT